MRRMGETSAARWVLALCGSGLSGVGCSSGGSNSGGGPALASNVIPVVVNAGPTGAQSSYVDGLFASATLCVPGNAASCQTIDGLLVDTGSTGVRILSAVLTLPLPKQTDDAGNAIANCSQFADGSYFFGPLVYADVQLGGGRASSLPIQVIADPASADFAKPPAACTSGGGQDQGTLDSLGANGILGVGLFEQDCGPGCATDSSPGIYFRCTSSLCDPTVVPVEKQMTNPLSAFAADNNGFSITLPDVPPDGSASVAGTLTLGIGTQANNALGSTTILVPDQVGNMTTVFQGQSYGSSTIDSGTNAVFFSSPAMSGLPTCKVNKDFYCPSATVDLSGSLVGADGASAGITFSVANADSLLAGDNYGFDDLAGPNAPSPGFLWGLPFFFHRTVVTAFDGRATPSGAGPYWAY